MDTDGFIIKQLRADDIIAARQLFLLLQQVFEVSQPAAISDRYAEKLLANPMFVALAAMNGSEIIGGLTAYILPMYDSEASEFYIYDIAVTPGFQRKGVGRKLLSEAQKFCRDNQITVMFVQANEEDTPALDLYRATKAAEQKVRHFTYLV